MDRLEKRFEIIKNILRDMQVYDQDDDDYELFATDINNGYNGDFHSEDRKAHTYSEIRNKADNILSENEED